MAVKAETVAVALVVFTSTQYNGSSAVVNKTR